GEPLLAVTESQPLDHATHLIKVTAFQSLEILPIAAIPIAGHFRLHSGNSRHQLHSLFPAYHRTQPYRPAGCCGDFQHQPSHGHSENIVILNRASDFFPDNVRNNSSSLPGTGYLV